MLRYASNYTIDHSHCYSVGRVGTRSLTLAQYLHHLSTLQSQTPRNGITQQNFRQLRFLDFTEYVL